MKKRWGLRGVRALTALVLGLILLFSVGCRVLALQPFRVSEYCTDQAGVLTEEQTREISQILRQFDRQTGNQMIVVTIPSLEGEDVTDFTQKMFETNKPGQKGKDNGLVMLIALREHKLWIATGYGLEEAVPDGKAGEIRDRMFPYFRANEYNEGIRAGAQLLMAAIAPGYSGAATEPPPERPRRSSSSALTWIIFLIIAAFSYLGNWGHSRRRRRGFSEPWFWGGGGFGGGGFGGGSGGFGGGDSGGFSGGGGDFGGGGAGGSW